MFRNLIAFFVSIALVLAGAQPGVATMLAQSINATEVNMEQLAQGHTNLRQENSDHGTMDHIHSGHMDMAETEMLPDHSCCRDAHDGAPCNGNCDAMSWLACALHCGMVAPVFTDAAEIMYRHPSLGVDRTPTHLSNLISVGDSPPFHPPKLFVRV